MHHAMAEVNHLGLEHGHDRRLMAEPASVGTHGWDCLVDSGLSSLRASIWAKPSIGGIEQSPALISESSDFAKNLKMSPSTTPP